MVRWHIVKGRKEEPELTKRFTDVQYEIDCWKSLKLTAGWADEKGIQEAVKNTLHSLEFGR